MARRNPEPVTMLLLGGAALVGLLLARKKKPTPTKLAVPAVHEAAAADQAPAADEAGCYEAKPAARAGYDVVCQAGRWKQRKHRRRTAGERAAAALAPMAPLSVGVASGPTLVLAVPAGPPGAAPGEGTRGMGRWR
jgi:hypothetical protein